MSSTSVPLPPVTPAFRGTAQERPRVANKRPLNERPLRIFLNNYVNIGFMDKGYMMKI